MVLCSGGVDSAVVLAAAARGLGPRAVVAVTAVSPAVPALDVSAAAALASALGVHHELVATEELDVEGYRRNGPDRCAYCKTTLLRTALEAVAAHGMAAVATGTNASDVAAGFRPGIAAAARLGARTPLADLGITKPEVRRIAREWNLDVWDKPAAACLASRIAYGVPVTGERLHRVGTAETAVRAACASAGLAVRDLRVRDLSHEVRVEVDAHLVAPLRQAAWLTGVLRGAGFAVPVTVSVFRSGSMNELLPDPQLWRHA
jgi:uncharacterized protein